MKVNKYFHIIFEFRSALYDGINILILVYACIIFL